MIGKLRDIIFTRSGEQIVSFSTRSDFREEFDSLKDCDVEIVVKKQRKRRSLDANAYCWVLIDKISAKSGCSKEQVYRNAIREIGGNSDVICVTSRAADKLRESWSKNGIGWITEAIPSKLEGCTNIILYYGSSTFDTEQMSRFIDSIIQDAQALGITTETPEQIANMLSLWAAAPKK